MSASDSTGTDERNHIYFDKHQRRRQVMVPRGFPNDIDATGFDDREVQVLKFLEMRVTELIVQTSEEPIRTGIESRGGLASAKNACNEMLRSLQLRHQIAASEANKVYPVALDGPPFVSGAPCVGVCVASARRGLRLARNGGKFTLRYVTRWAC